MLWLALHFPDFALQAVQTANDDAPLCLYEARRGRAVVIACNAAARAAGITAGMPLAAAQSLSVLSAVARDPRREAAALRRLARWAQQFTPVVSLQPPDGLLLEVAASRKLFGGLDALRRRIDAELAPLQYRASQGVAPTPGAAWLLARAGIDDAVTTPAQLGERIPPLPLDLLTLDDKRRQALRTLGIERIGDCLRLPRDGLVRRFGPALLAELDRLLGHQPDPRDIYQPPEHFHSQLMLPDTVQQTEPLLFLLRRLLHELAGFLRARGAGAQTMMVGLIGPQRPVERLTLTLLTPGNDAEHMLSLWREKLERHRLEAPVDGIELTVEKLLPLTASNLDLFSRASDEEADFTRFLERLRSRLGNDAIQRLASRHDHRPEKAGETTVWEADTARRDGKRFPERPLWLLDPPRPLHGEPPRLHDEPLTLLDGPERIESGWWDGADIRRDYYIARSATAQTLWIYRERQPQGRWFLHGYFG